MKKIYFLTLVLFVACQPTEKRFIDYVNPFIGTGGHGHTYPGAASPFGMVQLSPDSRLEGWDGCGGYHYSDSVIYGFSHTHLSGTGISDYADVLLMPTTGELLLTNGADGSQGYNSSFSHDKEIAQAGFYQVHLEDYGVEVELTVSPRAGFHRYTFPNDDEAQVVLDLDHRDKLTDVYLEQVDSVTFKGYRYSHEWATDQRIHFYAQFSSPIQDVTYRSDSLVVGLKFGKLDNPLLVKVGISAVDILGAQQNVEQEIPHWDFDKTKHTVQNAWESNLSKIQVHGRDEDHKTVFYTALYHSLLNPNIYIDVDGRYRGMDMNIHQDSTDNHYTIFSLWDTFRATHPLFTLIEQEKTNEFIRTFLRQYQQGGKLPIWELAANYTNCMIGYHAIPVIADAYAKGIRDYDVERAMDAMIYSANLDTDGLEFYKNKGFIAASDEPESVSKTLEYAYDDWCIAMMADSLGRMDVANDFYQRGQYYKNLYDPSTGFLRAKVNNNWFGPFLADEVNFNYTEANAWQYSTFSPQDIQGHIELMGGPQNLEKHLDSLFTADSQTSGREQVDITGLIGQYAHGNEPSHHMAYLYNYVGKPHKTQERVRQIMEEQYSVYPDGLSGNEDCGQMSSWYVLSAMGFYSVTPGLDYYTIGTPMFDQAQIKLENGQTFVVRADKLSPRNKYIQSATLNGQNYAMSYIQHSDIMTGGELIFLMGDEPSDWGSQSIPLSSITNNPLTPVPFFMAESQTFTDSLVVELGTAQEAIIRYTLDGSQPTLESPIYSSPIVLFKDALIKSKAFSSNGESQEVSAPFYKIDGSRSISIQSEYANQYAAAGDKTLIDYLRGTGSYRTGSWQGYRENLEATVDLGTIKPIDYLAIGFLQDIKSWIFYPPQVEFLVSEDGQDFRSIGIINNTFSDEEYGSFHQDFATQVNVSARYVKVKANNYGVCPDWHLGAGGVTWLFADELIIK
jgi:predicted alpha-1,2-mannosidase